MPTMRWTYKIHGGTHVSVRFHRICLISLRIARNATLTCGTPTRCPKNPLTCSNASPTNYNQQSPGGPMPPSSYGYDYHWHQHRDGNRASLMGLIGMEMVTVQTLLVASTVQRVFTSMQAFLDRAKLFWNSFRRSFGSRSDGVSVSICVWPAGIQ